MDTRETSTNTEPEMILVCGGCAAEARSVPGVEPEQVLLGEVDAGCQRCGAILGGVSFRIPAAIDTGMAPGAG